MKDERGKQTKIENINDSEISNERKRRQEGIIEGKKKNPVKE
jgi:hypothetical protein